MYLRAKLTVDPSRMTQIQSVRPTKAFGRMLSFLTAGLGNKKEEHETFTALVILQAINKAFRQSDVTNIVRLAVDGTDFYRDDAGRTDDMQEAMDALKERGDAQLNQVFGRIRLVAEHHDELMDTLLEVDIKRIHAPGEDPIQILVNSVPHAAVPKSGSADERREELRTKYGEQATHDELIRDSKAHFGVFMKDLQDNLGSAIGVDAMSCDISVRRLKSWKKKEDVSWKKNNFHDGGDPILAGYYGFDDDLTMLYFWGDMCSDNELHSQDCEVVSETGDPRSEHGPGVEIHDAADPNLTAETGGSSWVSDVFSSDASSTDSGSSCASSCGSSCGG